MFPRIKKTGKYQYLQVVENRREGRRTVQRVVATLGRVDELKAHGNLDALVRGLARFTGQLEVIEGYRSRELEAGAVRSVGPDLVFGCLWRGLGIADVLKGLLRGRKFEFDVERAVYLTVLHRLFESGSDRRAERWRRDVEVPGDDDLCLHHLYRAMRWLGEVREEVEERLYARRRDLFSKTRLCFFDTTTLMFEGEGGKETGRKGHSKDHRPDLNQMVVGAVLDEEGRPVCSGQWPGNESDQAALMEVVDRTRERFDLREVAWVTDRGMISAKTIQGLEERGLRYILGARMRSQKEVRDEVLARPGRYHEVAPNLLVKEVMVEGRRYIICFNPEEAAKDAADREAILDGLREKLAREPGSLVGSRGYRRFLRVERGSIRLDERKVRSEARFDGKYVLRTNTDLEASEVAVQYKRLLQVERLFRAAKTTLETRPIYHQWDATIHGHVFCSFLALVLMDELQRRLSAKGHEVEWDQVLKDLRSVCEVPVRKDNQWYVLRTPLQGVSGKVLQAVGVAPPPPCRPCGAKA